MLDVVLEWQTCESSGIPRRVRLNGRHFLGEVNEILLSQGHKREFRKLSNHLLREIDIGFKVPAARSYPRAASWLMKRIGLDSVVALEQIKRKYRHEIKKVIAGQFFGHSKRE